MSFSVGDWTRWLNVPIDNGAVGDARAYTLPRGWRGGCTIRRRAASDLPTLRGQVHKRPASPWQRDPVLGVPRKGSTNTVRRSSGFCGDLHSYEPYQ